MPEITLSAIEQLLDKQLKPIKTVMASLATSEELTEIKTTLAGVATTVWSRSGRGGLNIDQINLLDKRLYLPRWLDHSIDAICNLPVIGLVTAGVFALIVVPLILPHFLWRYRQHLINLRSTRRTAQ
jgi:hypothetical protein